MDQIIHLEWNEIYKCKWQINEKCKWRSNSPADNKTRIRTKHFFVANWKISCSSLISWKLSVYTMNIEVRKSCNNKKWTNAHQFGSFDYFHAKDYVSERLLSAWSIIFRLFCFPIRLCMWFRNLSYHPKQNTAEKVLKNSNVWIVFSQLPAMARSDDLTIILAFL